MAAGPVDTAERADRVGADGVPTLVFDGDCGFCTSSAGWVARRWRAPARVVPWQRLPAGVLDRLGLTEAQVSGAAWWVDGAGRTWRGHLAVARSLEPAGGGWAAVGRALRVPPFRWLAAAVYAVVARVRGRLPGATPACRGAGGQYR